MHRVKVDEGGLYPLNGCSRALFNAFFAFLSFFGNPWQPRFIFWFLFFYLRLYNIYCVHGCVCACMCVWIFCIAVVCLCVSYVYVHVCGRDLVGYVCTMGCSLHVVRGCATGASHASDHRSYPWYTYWGKITLLLAIYFSGTCVYVNIWIYI